MQVNPKTLGILGGGQLGRMSAIAAAHYGFKTHIYCPDVDSPASHVCAKVFIGEYNDKKKLKEFAASVDVISYEFENIPAETVQFLQTLKPVYPDERLLQVSQHRGQEKKFLNDIGIPTANWHTANSAKELYAATSEMSGDEVIIKTCRFGYDGKGQYKLQLKDNSLELAKKIWSDLGKSELIIEQMIDFSCEVSVIIARDKLGQSATYGPILNEHHDGILAKSTIPAFIPDEIAEKAKATITHLADAVDLVGVLTLELFVTPNNEIIANEIAPRTHNSGHLTIDAYTISQFEQHVRTVCGLPIGHPHRTHDAVMVNLIGKDVKKMGPWLEMPAANVHLYGKDEIKKGRKMGHVTITKPLNQLSLHSE
jgi:5-(carboxyamino)imidazole ribonucleotide synthase